MVLGKVYPVDRFDKQGDKLAPVFWGTTIFMNAKESLN